jgi:hypothetical protein
MAAILRSKSVHIFYWNALPCFKEDEVGGEFRVYGRGKKGTQHFSQ